MQSTCLSPRETWYLKVQLGETTFARMAHSSSIITKLAKSVFEGEGHAEVFSIHPLLKSAFAEVPWNLLSISVILATNFIRENTIKSY